MNVDSTNWPDGQQSRPTTPPVASSAAGATREVASSVRQEAGVVTSQAKQRVSSLLDQTRGEVGGELQKRSGELAGTLRGLSTQLGALAAGRTEETGQLAGYVTEAQDRVQQFATRLQEQGPQGVADDITRFARRRPGAFLALAGVTGFVVGRAVRATQARPSLSDTQSAMMPIEEPPTTPMLVSPAVMPADDPFLETGASFGATGLGVR